MIPTHIMQLAEALYIASSKTDNLSWFVLCQHNMEVPWIKSAYAIHEQLEKQGYRVAECD